MKGSGQKITEFREARGYTLNEFAKRAGVTYNAAKYWERQGIKSFRVLNIVAKLLNVRPELLIESTNGDT
jgi:transcriptional regulator with XRE-family HTH domain